MKMTFSMSSLIALLPGQMGMPELGILFMVGYKLNNLRFHAILNCIDYYGNRTISFILDDRLNNHIIEALS